VPERLARAPQAIGVQAAEVDALLEVDLGVARRLERTVPAMARVHVGVGHGPGAGCVWLPGHGGASSLFSMPRYGPVLYLSLG
jgi:hypothetical protein